MKKLVQLLPAILIIGSLVFHSCIPDDFEGDFDDPVEKFLGAWKCEETGDVNGYFGPFDVEIVRNPSNSAEILIRNFNYQGADVEARAIVAGNSIAIPRQLICDDTIEIAGSGTFRNEQFTLTYTTNNGADLENISARFFRK